MEVRTASSPATSAATRRTASSARSRLSVRGSTRGTHEGPADTSEYSLRGSTAAPANAHAGGAASTVAGGGPSSTTPSSSPLASLRKTMERLGRISVPTEVHGNDTVPATLVLDTSHTVNQVSRGRSGSLLVFSDEKSRVLTRVLRDPAWRAELREFMKSRRADEGVLFYEAVDSLQLGTPAEQLVKARNAVDRFVSDSGPTQIHLSRLTREALLAARDSDDLACAFAPAVGEVFDDLKMSDGFAQFLQTSVSFEDGRLEVRSGIAAIRASGDSTMSGVRSSADSAGE